MALGIGLYADQVFMLDGGAYTGKASFAENGDVKIAGQTLKSSGVQSVIFDVKKPKHGLSDVSFKLYQGNWDRLPDFSKLAIDKSGRMSSGRIDLSPLELDGANRIFNLKNGDTYNRWSSPPVEGRLFSIRGTIEASGDGVLIAQGGNLDGFALYLQGGNLHFVMRNNRKLTVARDEQPFPLNQPIKILAELRRDLNLALTVDGREVAAVESPGLLQRRPEEGLSVGFDQRPSLVGSYRNDNHFQGSFKDLQLRVMGVGVVYSGKLNVVNSGEYEFKLSSGSDTWLEINGQKIINNSGQESRSESQVKTNLKAGTHKLRLMYAQLAKDSKVPAGSHLTLEFSGPGVPNQFLTTTPHPQAFTWKPADNAIPSAGLLTLNGSFIAKPIKRIDRSKVYLTDRSLPRKDVSIIFLRNLSIFESSQLTDKKPGALLMDGTYTEGKLLSLDENIAAVSSILFGIKRLKPGHEAAAIILKLTQPVASKKSILLHDGSLVFTDNYLVKNDKVILSDPPFNDQPIPLAEIAEISHIAMSNHFESANTKWDAHSFFGQHFLGERTRKSMELARRYREAQFKLAAAKKSMAEAIRALPALVNAETKELPIYEKAKAEYDVVRAAAEMRKKEHKPLADLQINAMRKLETECDKVERVDEALRNLIKSRREPVVAKIKQIREQMRVSGETPAGKANLTVAEKQLAAAESQIMILNSALNEAVRIELEADQAELEAQLVEAKAWQNLHLAQQVMKKVEQVYRGIELDYLGKQSAANSIRQKMARAKRDGDLAIGQIEVLKPKLQIIFQP